MSSTNRKYIQQLKKGDVIKANGAVFEITEDAYESDGHYCSKHQQYEAAMKRQPIIQELRNDPSLCLVAVTCVALTVAWAWLVAVVLF